MLFLEAYGLDGLMGLFHLTICDFCLYTVLHSLFPLPSPSANWDWLREGLRENELSLKLSASLSHPYKWGSHKASALSGKLSLSRSLNIQDVQNKLQRADVSANTCLLKISLLPKDACSTHTDTHSLQKASVLPTAMSNIFLWKPEEFSHVFVLRKKNCRIV